MKYFFKDNKKPDLCLVFCGWGTDERLYLPVLKDMDYLLCFNYDKECEFNPDTDFSKYENIYLLSYSAGGFIPAVIKDKLPEIKMSVSVNSSPSLYGKYGLHDDFVEVTNNLNITNYLDFRRNYMVDSDWEFDLFNENQPYRSFEDCFAELDTLKYLSEKYKGCKYDFDRAYSAVKDKIILHEEQKEYFGNKLIPIEGAHFPFYRYKSLKEFFE